jgi:23S rRNA maturation mini-RNase III
MPLLGSFHREHSFSLSMVMLVLTSSRRWRMSLYQDTTKALRSAEEDGAYLQKNWDSMQEEKRQAMKRRVIEQQRSSSGKYDHVTCLAALVGRLPVSASRQK